MSRFRSETVHMTTIFGIVEILSSFKATETTFCWGSPHSWGQPKQICNRLPLYWQRTQRLVVKDLLLQVIETTILEGLEKMSSFHGSTFAQQILLQIPTALPRLQNNGQGKISYTSQTINRFELA